MRLFLLLLLFLLINPNHLFSQIFDVKANYVKREVYIPMRDGVKLFTAIYLPKDSSVKYPVLLNRTPYSVGPYGADAFPERLRPSDLFARDGYIFVFQDVRGKSMSEGEFVNMTPQKTSKKSKLDVDESTDTYDCIEWLLKNINYHNGKVGQWGISYPGFYTSAGMIDAHPALIASSPQAPICDWFTGDDFHHNGAVYLPHFFGFFYGFGQARLKPGPGSWKSIDYKTTDGYKFYLELGGLKNINNYYNHSVAFWDEMTQHETYDSFWQARNLRPHFKNIKPAVLVVGGWFDAENLYGALQTYKTIEKQSSKTTNSLVMGPWVHGGWGRGTGEYLGDINFRHKTSWYYRDSIEYPFFSYYLKGKGDWKLPEAIMFETGSNLWRKYEQWPPKNIEEKKYYLNEQGNMNLSSSGNNYDEFISDPNKPVPYMVNCDLGMTREYMVADQRYGARRPDVLVYQTSISTQDQTFAGPVKVNLKVSTSSTDADWIVKIIDVYPDKMPNDTINGKAINMDAYQMLIRGEVMRGKFRNSFEKPEPFVPNQITDVNFEINDINHTIKKGHRLMIQIQSTWFPLVDRNPQKFINIFEAEANDFVKATHRVYRGSTVTFLQIK
ncbi:MAG: CocE/NonD family hydrolase [Bacteroidota bacterium]|nr:CocE/NonD family hydrolase [Bacteroidota bacterium]